MRCDQHAGLNKWATEFVKGDQVLAYHVKETRRYPDGKIEEIPEYEVHKSTVTTAPSGEHYTGMFGDEFPLSKYTFADGRILHEAVQAEPWSSGPVFFLALQDENGDWIKESLWPKKDLDNA